MFGLGIMKFVLLKIYMQMNAIDVHIIIIYKCLTSLDVMDFMLRFIGFPVFWKSCYH